MSNCRPLIRRCSRPEAVSHLQRFTGAVIGEWTASTSGGLGAYLLQANSRLNTAGTFAAIAFLALLGVVSFLMVLALEYLVTP